MAKFQECEVDCACLLISRCSRSLCQYKFKEQVNPESMIHYNLTHRENVKGRAKGLKDSIVIDMPEEMLVGQCLPPYYISQLGDCIIISGSFKFVDFSIIYAWELQVDDGEVSWYRKLFTLPYPIEHDLKLIGFTKDKQPIVEASFVQQLHQSLQVFNPTFQIFQNLVVESNHGSFFIGPYKESLILLNV
ncbi:hypothetical protein Tco_0859201 [Tanacetum coccineum]|uniref:F-box associated domain-containing protein n=1 Tax=Tanacetum coccineum TaxID=301880 RepID=A0ABQ5BGZ8_9ASTR